MLGTSQQPNYISLLGLSLALGLGVAVWIYYEKVSRTRNLLSSPGSIFPMLSGITYLIILVVQNSIALSLGIVGALSIVRFRTPVKEPEELVHIFVSVAIGIGCAAGAWQITSVVIFLIYLIDFAKGYLFKQKSEERTIVIEYSSTDPIAVMADMFMIAQSESMLTKVIKFQTHEHQSILIITALIEESEKVLSSLNSAFPTAKLELYDTRA